MQTPASSWLFDPSYHALLLGGLSMAVLLGWLTWRRRPSPASRYVWLGAASILATMVLRVPFTALADARGMAPALWVAPFDRLLGTTMLVMLGWTLTTGPRSWRVFLAAGFTATAITYLSWAPTWAEEFARQPGMAALPSSAAPVLGLTRVWDAWQILLALAVGGSLVRARPQAPRWLLAAVAALAVGSAFELLDPATAFPAWSRLGTLAAGAMFFAAAVSQILGLRDDVPPPMPLAPMPVAPGPTDGDAESEDPTADGIATQVLFETMARIGAAPALFCLVTDRGELTVWGVARAGEGSRRLGELPLAGHPTISRALGSRGIRLRTSRIAKDVTQLYGLMGVSADGPVMLYPVTSTGSQGVIVAGRPSGRWRESDQATLATVARRAARQLERLDAPETEDQIEHVFDVLESQTESVTRLARIVEGLSERLVDLETDRSGAAGSAAAAPAVPGGGTIDPDTAGTLGPGAAAPEAATPAASQAPYSDVDTRVLRYEKTLEALPWGVMVCDAGGGVVFANGATSRLLHVDGLYPGQPVVELVPDGNRMAAALERCQVQAGDGAPVVDMVLQSPAVRLELEALYDEDLGYLGAVAVIRPRADDIIVDDRVMMGLADALKSPITSILGYSDLVSRGVGLSQDQLDRYVQRIDANLARMQVHLDNLVTVVNVSTHKLRLEPARVDLAQALAAAQERCRLQLEEKSLVVEVSAAADLPPVSADSAALSQILDNLIAAAAQRSPQGGDLALATELRVDPAGGRAAVVSLADRGQSPGGNGAGTLAIDDVPPPNVGLTVVRMLAEAQGGRAWAEAHSGRTTFFVRLPLRRTAAPADGGDNGSGADGGDNGSGADGGGADGGGIPGADEGGIPGAAPGGADGASSEAAAAGAGPG